MWLKQNADQIFPDFGMKWVNIHCWLTHPLFLQGIFALAAYLSPRLLYTPESCSILAMFFHYFFLAQFTTTFIQVAPLFQKQPPEVLYKKRCSIKKGALKNFTKFTGKHLCQSLFLIKLQALTTKAPEWRHSGVFFVKACNFIKKETLAQVISCEFCKNFKNTFLNRTPPFAASGICM